MPGDLALRVPPSLIFGNELLIPGGVALAVGGWLLAPRQLLAEQGRRRSCPRGTPACWLPIGNKMLLYKAGGTPALLWQPLSARGITGPQRATRAVHNTHNNKRKASNI